MSVFLKIFLLVFLIVSVEACKKKTEASMKENLSDTTTIQNLVSIDSLLNTGISTHKSIDEFFDDFIFAFTKNKSFQNTRIEFPLSYIVDGHKKELLLSQWKFDKMYSCQDVYVSVFDSYEAEQKFRSSELTQVLMQEVLLQQKKSKTYTFERRKEGWKLVQIIEKKINLSDEQEFHHFYLKFATQPDFQQKHLAQPLKFSTYDEDSFEKVNGFIAAEQWRDFAPELPSRQLTNIVYDSVQNDTDIRILKITSLSGGMNSTLTFERKKKIWYLTKLDN